ncbi:MAG TPA: hypothetical protein DCE61_00130 [Cellvibrionales bacterium]|nr:hypothetical protein [Cellvibrionales bacterium]
MVKCSEDSLLKHNGLNDGSYTFSIDHISFIDHIIFSHTQRFQQLHSMNRELLFITQKLNFINY